MEREEILLKQYEIFSQRKLHFGRLFWQTPAFFIAICVFLANVVKNKESSTIWWFVMTVGLLMILVSYIGHRLRTNEDQYETLLLDIENDLQQNIEGKIYHAHLSSKRGARFFTSAILFLFGLALLLLGLTKILSCA